MLYSFFPIGSTPTFLTFDDPFPLVGPGQRQVNLDWNTGERSRTKIASGTAVTSPFALCPEKPYHFDIHSTPQILEFTATSSGFGQPIYSWWINGRPVAPPEFVTLPAIVTVDDTTNPTKHTTMSGSSPTTASAMVGIELACERIPTTWREATLRVYTTGLDIDVIGHVDLTVEVEAKDAHMSPGVPTSAVVWLTMHNETVVWEDQYTNDAGACRRQWRQITKRYLHYKHIDPLLTLPDPPRAYGRVIREIQAVVVALEEARESTPEVAEAAERAVHVVFGLTSDGLGIVAEQFRAGMEQ